MDDSPFRKLSAELRNTIYEYALVHDQSIDVHLRGQNRPTLLRHDAQYDLTALTATCKQARQEALPIFFNKNHFKICVNTYSDPYKPCVDPDVLSQRVVEGPIDRAILISNGNIKWERTEMELTAWGEVEPTRPVKDWREFPEYVAAVLKHTKANLRRQAPRMKLVSRLGSHGILWCEPKGDMRGFRDFYITIALSGTSLTRVRATVQEAVAKMETEMYRGPNRELTDNNYINLHDTGAFAMAVVEKLDSDPDWSWEI